MPGQTESSKVKKKNGDELFTSKAYNGRVILSWLSHTLLLAVRQHPNHAILLLTSSAMKLGWFKFAVVWTPKFLGEINYVGMVKHIFGS